MVRALEKGPRQVSNRRSWLAVVTRNLASNRRRTDTRRVAREQAIVADRSVPSTSEVAEREQLRTQVVAAVMELPEAFRAVVLLRHYRGLDTRECAAELGIPESTVRTRLKRGLDQLRAQLDDAHGGDRAAWVTALLPLALEGSVVTAPVAAAGVKKMALFALLLFVPVAVAVWAPWNRPVAVIPAGASGSTSSSPDENKVAEVAGGPSTDRPSRVAATMDPVVGAKQPWQLRGVVQSAESGEPIAAAMVRVWIAPRNEPNKLADVQEVRADANGMFVVSLAEIREVPIEWRRDYVACVLPEAAGFEQQMPDFESLQNYSGEERDMVVAMVPGQFCQGRVVDRAGNGLANASVMMFAGDVMRRVMTRMDGRFAMPSLPLSEHGFDRVLLAVHDNHGFSRAKYVTLAGDGEVSVGDLVVADALGVVTGVVRNPSGAGVPGIKVIAARRRVPDEPSDYTVDGVLIANFRDVIGNGSAGNYEAITDEDGRFVFRSLRPGRHTVAPSGLGVAQQVDVTAATDALEFVVEDAFVNVRAEDVDGQPVLMDRYALYSWQGAEAEVAARRFASSGPAREVLATGRRLAALNHGHRLRRTPNTFLVVEADIPDVGACYGSCLLGADDYRGEAVVAVALEHDSGAVRVMVKDEDGAAVTPVLIKVCRVPGSRAVPVVVSGQRVIRQPGSMILGDWWRVPEGGLVSGLPCGELTFEVMAGAQLVGNSVAAEPFLVSQQSVTVVRGEEARLDAVAQHGIVPVFDLELTGPQEGRPTAIDHVEVYLNAVDGSRNIALPLVAATDRGLKFQGGRCRVRSRSAVAAGTYRVTVLWHNMAPYQQRPASVTLHMGMAPIPLQFTR